MFVIEIKTLLANKDNYTNGRIKKIEYIVIHYTANQNDTAESNCKYFQGAGKGASAHYFVDENDIYLSVDETDTAWHCGSKTYKHSYCRNENSIGIELCPDYTKSKGYYFTEATLKNAIDLTKSLMKKYNIPIQNILRHYDVTGKICPKPFVDNIDNWNNFKKRLESESYMHVNRKYTYNGKTEIIDAISENGKLYINPSSFAPLLKLNVRYDNTSKETIFTDILDKVVVTDEKGTTTTYIDAKNIGGYNFVQIRPLADFLGYDTNFNETTRKIFFTVKKSVKDTFVEKLKSLVGNNKN